MKHFLRWISVLLSLVISSAQAADIQGLWKVKSGASGGETNGDWIMSINDGIIHGSAYWHAPPTSGTHDNIDRVMGSINGNTVSIIRYLSPEVFAGKTQTFTGTINGTSISGSWDGIGCTDSCVWTATITPLTTSSTVNCPTPPVCPTPPACPVCPVTPACPVTPPTGDCTATYNADTGKFTAPCVAVPVVEPFVGKKILNYSIEMQQRTGAYTFDLDLNTVKQRQ